MNGSSSGLTSGNQISLEQSEYQDKVLSNESSVGFLINDIIDNKEINSPDFYSMPKNIEKDKQGKHIEGHKNYKKGKSTITISLSELQQLSNRFSGKGERIGTNKERVDFGKTIGYYVDPNTGKKHATSIGIIHHSKKGTHIVPSRPKGDK